ncbi:CxxxxCH/CxxCH domain c-type cytochrome [Geomobilimonas luticola]|nr:CxxxxCH/CxxCH domain-containing protein [Geomobilimonas luticola]
MKRHRVAGNSLIPVIAVLFSLMALLVQTGIVYAAPITDCAGCHGMPPLDDATRNITTGGFQGNHQTHQPAAAVAGNCGACHGGGVVGYNNAHRDGFIRFSSSINGSPATGAYSRGTFFAQSATPALGTCSNINCHFEKVTPTWGSASFTYTDSATNDCDQCHGAAPSDGNHPVTGQKHAAYYGTTTGSCVKCHSDHTAEANKFAHATSAGNRGLQVLFTAAPNDSGTYSGNVSYPNYLPSKSPARNGTCTNLYCHSPGTKATGVDLPNATATWGGTLDCRGCHKADFNGTAGSDIQTGSHRAHVNGFGVAYNTIKCVTCHAVTATAGMTIATYGNHVDKQVQVAFDNTSSAAAGSYNAQLATPASPSVKAPGSAVGQCSNVYCHSTGQGANGSWPPTYQTPTWGTPATGRCGTCHAVNNDHSGQASVAPVNSGSHTKHLTYTFGIAQEETRCAACHMTSTNQADFSPSACSSNACHAVMNQKHANYEINVGMPDYFGVSATYNGTTKPGDGYNSCVSVYCHSDGQGTPTYAPAVTWGSGTLNCASCHGTAAANGAGGSALSGKHAAHVNNAAAFGTNNSFGCVDCHQKTVADNSTLNATTGTTVHVNKFVDYTGLRAGGSARYNSGTKQCSNIYCHSNGNATSLVYVNPAAWNSATSYGCNGCHGTSNATTGAPDYASGGADSATRNSHTKHVAGAGVTDTTGCATCHYRTVDAAVAGKLRNYSTMHLNGAENVAFKVIAGKTGVYNADTTCSATYCHGTAASPKWGLTVGVPLACNTCHGASNALPGAHAQHWETATLATSYTLTPVNSGNAGSYQFNCSSCHRPGSAYAVHATGPAHANGAGQVFFGYTSATRKGTYTFATTQGNDNGFTWTNGTCASTYCHSNGNGANPVNAAFTWASPNGTLNCGGCHNKAGDATWSGSASHLKHVTAYSGSNTISCGSCHSLTASSNTAVSDKTKHVNKVKDVNFSAWAGGTWSGTTCSNTYCHSTGVNPGAPTHAAISWAAPPTVNCDSCHGGTAANPPASSPHVKHVGTAAGYKFACVKCHARTVKATADSTTFATISSVHLHLNKLKDVAFDSTVNGSWDGTTCSATYCHSKGTGGTSQTGDVRPITAGTNPTWSGTLNCGACHGGGNANGQPEYANNSLKTNSHGKHPTDCSRCHYATTTDGTTIATPANHANRTYDLLQKTGTIFSYTYASNGGTCSGIGVAGAAGRCHFAGNAQWGETLTCDRCHDINTLSGAHKRHVGGLNLATIPFYAYTANQSVGGDTDGVTWKAYSFGCANCHPVDRGVYHANDSVQVQLDNRVGVSKLRSLNPVTAATSKAPGAGDLQCLNIYCHSDGKGNYVTTPAWNTTVSVANRCGLCHGNSPTGDSHAAHTNYASIHEADIYQGPGYSGKLSTSTVSKTHGDPAQSTTISCNICHKDTINFARNKYNSSCSAASCHGNATGNNADALGAARITGLDKHVNGTKDVSFTTVAVKSKAQLRPASYDSTVWTRSAYKGGPTASGSFDTAKTALSNTMFSGGNCSNISCHNGKSVNWTNDYGKAVSCTICHDSL